MPKGAELSCHFPIQCCKECQNRKKDCHSTCDTYKQEVEQRKAKMEWLKSKNSSIMSKRAFDKRLPTLLENPKRRIRRRRKT